MKDLNQQENSVCMAFDKVKQLAILGHLLVDSNFFLQSQDKVKPEWFSEPYIAKVFKLKLDFTKRYGRPPSVEELKSSADLKSEQVFQVSRLLETITMALHRRLEFGLDVLSQELTEWMHSVIYQKSVEKSAALYNAKKQKDAFKVMHEAMQEIRLSTFFNDNEIKFNNYEQQFEINQNQLFDGLTTGIKIFDQQLNPDAPNGPLLKGDMSLVISPTNQGKTTHLCTITRHNLYLQKHILFIYHEGKNSEMQEKFWCAMVGCTRGELYGNQSRGILPLHKTEEGQKRLEIARRFMNKYFTLLPMHTAGLTVEEVASVIRRKNEELKLKNNGNGYDMVVNDYPALLNSDKYGSKDSRRLKDGYVYGYMTQLALEMNYHFLCVIQTNREGARVNSGQKEDRLLTKEDVLESYEPTNRAANIWTINRSPEAKLNNRITFYVDKSRSSATGQAIVCRSKYDHCITHSEELGGTWYYGTSTYSQVIEKMMEQYKNKKIDEQELLK